MNFRFLRPLCLFLSSVLLIVACNYSETVTPPPQQVPLRVGYSLWPGYFPIAIAEAKGFFEQQGVQVEAVYSTNYLEPVSAFSAGQYDGVTLAWGTMMSIVGQNPEVQLVLITDQSAGSDALVVQSDIQSVADLKGKRIGLKLGDFGELFVTKLLESHQLTPDDVAFVNVEGERVPERLATGNIQAGHTWVPYSLQAIKAGAKVLVTSEQTPGLIPSGVVFRSDVIRDRPTEVLAFVRAWFQAQEYWQAHPEEIQTLLAKQFNVTKDEISHQGIKLYNLQDNLQALTPGNTTESLYYTAKLYADFFIRTGGLSTAPDINKLIEPTFIQQLQKGQTS